MVSNNNGEKNTNIQINNKSDSTRYKLFQPEISSQNEMVAKQVSEQQKAMSSDNGTESKSDQSQITSNAINSSLITNIDTKRSSVSAEETLKASKFFTKEYTKNSISDENGGDTSETNVILNILNFQKKILIEDMYAYFKTNTTDEIYNDIIAIHMKNRFSGTELKESCVVNFKTSEIALKAKHILEKLILKDDKQPYKGPILIHIPSKYKRQASESSEDNIPQKKSKPSEFTTPKPTTNVMFLKYMPTTWVLSDVEKFIKGHIEKAARESILFIHMDKVRNGPSCADTTALRSGCCHVLFNNPDMCTAAIAQLRRHSKRNNLGILVKYEFPHSKFAIPWKNNNIPDMAKIMSSKANDSANYNNVKAVCSHNTHQGNIPPNNKDPVIKQINRKYKQIENINMWSQRNNVLSCSTLLYENDNETYGLNMEFLESKNIRLPLKAKVFVEYLPTQYNSEPQIRKMFLHAGKVFSVSFSQKNADMVRARVTYDHPLEAVQAILMFDGQTLFGKRIKVKMDQFYDDPSLPPGLYDVGPGLGPNGKPMRDIRYTIEFKQHSDMIMNRLESVEKSIDSLRQSVESLRKSFQDDSVPNSLSALPSALSALLNPQAAQLLQLLQQQNPNNTLQQAQHSASYPNSHTSGACWNYNQPSNTQSVSPHFNPIIQATTNMQPTPNPQVESMQNHSEAQNQQNMWTANMQGDFTNANFNAMLWKDKVNFAAWQHGQGSNMASGQGIQNASNTEYGQNQNVSANVAQQFAQRAQSMPPQFAQGSQNMAQQFSQGAQNPASQFSQGTQSVLSQFAQGTQNVPQQWAHGTQYSAPQPSQGALNMPQFSLGAQNVAPQLVQGTQNVAPQITQRVKNVALQIDHGVQNVTPEVAQVTQNEPTTMKKVPTMPPPIPQVKVQKKNEKREKYTVKFSHLPASVTGPSLKNKMSELGEVRDVEMTGPGRARVTFYSSRDAATCIKLLDHTKVDGQTIEVKYD